MLTCIKKTKISPFHPKHVMTFDLALYKPVGLGIVIVVLSKANDFDFRYK